MRNFIVVAITLVATGFGLAAQSAPNSTPPNTGQSTANRKVTIEGCLTGVEGRYTVQEKNSGTTYLLVGDNERFANYVSQEVRISGTPATKAGSPNSVTSTDISGGTPEPGQPRLNVASVTRLSDSCTSPI
jgi:hypothetical protein